MVIPQDISIHQMNRFFHKNFSRTPRIQKRSIRFRMER